MRELAPPGRTLATAGLLLALAGCGGADSGSPVTGFTENNPDGLNGAVLADEYIVPDVRLTATDGTSYSLRKDTRAPLTLVFFGYTHCPDICQVVMADIASALTRLDETDRNRVGVLFVTTDPARDDPATLRRYLDRFDPRFEGLTGDPRTIVTAAHALGVAVDNGRRLPSGGHEIDHGTQVVGVDSRDRAPVVWTQGTSPAQLAQDLTTLLRGREGRSS